MTPSGPPASRRKAPAWTIAGLFLGIVAILVGSCRIPLVLLGLYVVASTTAFFVYWGDKRAAQRGQWRTSEVFLHALDLVGGWPGGLLARHLFKHKTRKGGFILVFWATVALNCWALSWLLSPEGQRFLKGLTKAQ